MNDARVWDPVRQALPARRTVVTAQTHIAGSIADLAAALASMPRGGFAVAGFSLGGYVALEVCRQARDQSPASPSWTPSHGPIRRSRNSIASA